MTESDLPMSQLKSMSLVHSSDVWEWPTHITAQIYDASTQPDDWEWPTHVTAQIYDASTQPDDWERPTHVTAQIHVACTQLRCLRVTYPCHSPKMMETSNSTI